jgi:hypothetical protein
MAGESSGSPIAPGDVARRLLIPALLAIALIGCGADSEDGSPPAAASGARECADRWNASGGDAVRYMSDLAEAGGEDAFVGSLDGDCVIYAQNPGDRGEVYVFEEKGGQWSEPKRADVPQRRRLDSNARILGGGRIALDE